MKKNIIKASAIGKIILMGEHAVVYGEPAIAIPFASAKIRVFIQEIDGPIMIKSHLYKGPFDQAFENLYPVFALVNKILKKFNKDPFGFSIEIKSTIPVERGMGSSAALAAATVKVLYKYFKVDLTPNTLNHLVNFSENIVHGNASGIDSAIVINEKPLYFIKNQPLKHFNYKLDGYLIVSDTGEKGNTKLAVSKVKEYINQQPETGITLIKDLGKLTVKAKKVILKNNPEKLGILMNQAQIILEKLGVSNNKIEKLVQVSLDHRALGAKLTGGGLGGCVITLCANKADAQKISQKLLENGASKTWLMKLNNKENFNES